MDFRYQAAIARALGKFVEQGLVYKGKKPVHWCIHCRTALAEAEVEYEDHTSPSIYVEFPARGCERRPELAARVPALAGRDGLGPHLDDDALDDPVEPRRRVPSASSTTPPTTWTAARSSSRRRSPPPVAQAVGRAFDRPIARMKGEQLEGVRFRHPLYDRDSLGVLGDYVTLEPAPARCTRRPATAPTTSTRASYGLEIYAPIGPGGHSTMTLIRTGQPAPDVVLAPLDGPAAPLSAYWGNGRHALLIFLRHLA